MDEKRTKAAIEAVITLIDRRVDQAIGWKGGSSPTSLPSWGMACEILAEHLKEAADVILTLVEYHDQIVEANKMVEHWQKEAALYGANHNRLMDQMKDEGAENDA